MTKSSGSISNKADLLPLLASLQMVLEALGEKTAEVEQLQEQLDGLREDQRAAESDRVWYRTLLDSIGEGLIVIDSRGTIANANPSAAKMLGYTQKEMIGQWFPRMVQAFGEDGSTVDPLDRPAIRSLAGGRIISESIYYRRKGGGMFPAAVTVSPVVIKGKPQGAIEVFRDLTQERELDRAKEEFVSLASHQLRTPATGVKAYISMLLDGYAGKMTERQKEFLYKVFDSNERQLQIVNDMLNVARADAGRIIPEMVSTNLSALVRDIIDEQAATIRERRQKLKLELAAVRVEGVVDPKLMRMVMENILSNASKYTPEGGTVTVELAMTERLITLSVSDTGVGIAQDDLPRLFKRFSRINNPLSTQRGGSGLGLYLAQTIVLLHQGRLSVESEVGVGTRFTVELPLDRAASILPGVLRGVSV
jgi:PAS domain S-box-containing protein